MYTSLRDTVNDLATKNDLAVVDIPVQSQLEMAEIHRRIFEAKGPALLFKQIIGCKFQAVSNIYGTKSRIDYLFHKSMPIVKKLGQLRSDPSLALKKPLEYGRTALHARFALPKKLKNSTLVQTCSISDLPLITSWPLDGGAFVLLPQVFSLPPGTQDVMKSNMGMYRIQLNGNEYELNKEIGLHYQLHRGIGVHHTAYLESEEDFKVSVFIGGPPSHALSAIFPLPENLSELTFAGLLNGNRFTYTIDQKGYIISDQADFVITGTVVKNINKPEGPFGDHLGYYSLKHPFPYLKIDTVYHRPNPLWHFTVVGRPPQEDSMFGYLIHEVVKDLIPKEFPGLHAMHAVDVAGVHPLLLAIGHERYMPFRERKPEEILTIANRILGSGQTSLAKYLFITAPEPDINLNIYDIPNYFKYLLQRIRFERDLHFITNTTIDTLDYAGTGWNTGSKVIFAACGEPIRTLRAQLPDQIDFNPFSSPRFVDIGIVCIQGSAFTTYEHEVKYIEALCQKLEKYDTESIPLIVLCDDSEFSSASWDNFLWVTFTRSNPSHDIYGVQSFVQFKHWGCKKSLIIDARIKPHHAPVLEVDATVSAHVDRLFSKGGPLYGLNKKSNPTY